MGSTVVALADGTQAQIDVVVAADDAGEGSERTVVAIGEAKVGERISQRHLHRLEEARVALGDRAAGAKLLLFGSAFTAALVELSAGRADVELIDLARLYSGS